MQLPDVLNHVAGGIGSQAFELGLDFRYGEQSLLGGFRNGRLVTSQDNLILISVLVLVKQCLLVVNGTRSDFHFDGMLLGILLHLLQMFVVAVLGQPSNDILRGPIDLKRVGVLLIDMVLTR